MTFSSLTIAVPFSIHLVCRADTLVHLPPEVRKMDFSLKTVCFRSLPQKVLFHSWYMYVRHTIGIVISRAFRLNIEYNFHKFELLFDSKFSLELWVIRCCATDKQADWLFQFQLHPPHCIGVNSNSFDLIFSTYIYVEP